MTFYEFLVYALSLSTPEEELDILELGLRNDLPWAYWDCEPAKAYARRRAGWVSK